MPIERAHIPSEAVELPLADEHDVRFTTGATEQPLTDAEWVLVAGRGYETEGSAREAAARWRGYVERGFARANIPADFTASTGVLTGEGERMFEEQLGTRVLSEFPVNVFEDDQPPPRFVRSEAKGRVGRNLAVTLGSIRAAAAMDLRVAEAEALAYNLYSGSFAQSREDARFMMLMVAVETLISLQPRAPEVQEHVRTLIRLTSEAGISGEERTSITGSLEWLLEESINQGGRRLAMERLDGRQYAGDPPDTFFSKCYSIRSGLVHGSHPQPSLDGRVADLERFVADLLSAELLEAVDVGALAERASTGNG
jgi:hypothetical protein